MRFSRFRWMQLILIAVSVCSLLLFNSMGVLAQPQNPQANKHNLAAQADRQEKRQQDYLKKHSDSSGKARPDLWKKGLDYASKMPISASVALATTNSSATPVLGVQWTQIGPAPLIINAEQNYQGQGPDSGQVTDLAIDPRGTTDRVVYISTNDGGIWKTEDGGTSWKPKTETMPSLSMGALALDPANPSIVYAGTGNLFNNGFMNGVGIYKSIDGGDSWTTLNPGGIFSGRGINRIVMPSAGILLVATRVGLFRSADGGLNFGSNAPTFNNGSPVRGGFITDIHLDTTAPTTTILVAVSGQGIFQSTDGGQTFPTNLFGAANVTPVTPTSSFGYISFGQSTAPNNQTLYVTVQDTTPNPSPPPGVVEPFKGLYVSTDGGANWTRNAGADASGSQCQCGYDQTVAVDPANPQRVFIGFQQLYLSTNGGNNFSNVSASKIHWDHHAIYFSPASHPSPGPNSRMWVGTDGGIHRTDDAGGNWANLNAGIATNLFRQIDIGRGSATNNKYTYGGTQDTGTIGHRDGDTALEWHLGIDGDGGPTAVDPCQPQHVIGDDNGGYIQTTNGGNTWGGGAGFPAGGSVGWVTFDPNCGVAYASIAFPNSAAPPVTQFGLARSADNGNNFITMQQFPFAVTALGTSKLDSNLFYVGLLDGTLRRTNNAGAGASSSWTAVNVTGVPGGLQVGSVAVDPTNTAVVVVTYEGFTSINPATSPTKHVFMTVDNGANWSDISGVVGGSQNYPDLPTHSVVIDGGTSPHSIIVSNDAGVMRTTNNGASWQKFGVGLPAVDSTALALDDSVSPSLLRVGTYGRSTFELTSSTGPALAVNADLAFGAVGIGQTSTKIIQLFNVGATDLHIFSFNFTSGSTDFQLTSGPNTPVTIQPGEELDYTMRFLPTSAGNLSAVFSINSDDPNQPVYQLFPNGIGVAPKIAVSGDLNFGVVARGTKATRDIVVQNTGGAPLVIAASGVAFIGSSDPSFSVLRPSTPQTIAPGGSLVFTIQFAPLANDPGTLKTGTLRILSNDPTNPSVTLAATGTPGVPRLNVTSSLAFGSLAVDDRTIPNTADQKLVISNQSSCSLCDVSVSGLNITGVNAGDFSLVGSPTLPVTISANNSLEFTIRFNPSGGGNRTATLSVVSNDPANSNVLVSLSGVGLLPAITTSPNPLIFGPTVYDPVCSGVCGQTKPETITDSGLSQLILDLFTFSGSGSSAFSGPPAASPPDRVNPTLSFIEQVTFRPTSSPSRAVRANLRVTDTMGPSPTDLPVTADIPLCGESVGRGIRVIVYDTSGNIVQNVTRLSLQSHGLTNPVNIQLKNQALTTIDPPTSCQRIQFEYENQNLQAVGIAAQPGSYYTLSVTVGNKKASVSFPLGVNEFKIITLTVQ